MPGQTDFVAVADGLIAGTADAPELIGSRCRNCGVVAFPRQASCAACTSRDVEERRLGRRGTLWTWTIQCFAPKSPPYAGAADHQTKFVDMQLDVNLRAIVLFYRECADMLRAAGAEHRNALVVNMASLAGKSPQPWLSVYAATKAAVVAYTSAMNKELNSEGVKSVAFCPGFVDTDMTEFIRDTVPPEEMLRTTDITAALRFLLHVSPACVVPEIVFQRPGEAI